MKFLFLGAGGTGGYFGGRLHEAGGEVTFLVREKRAAQLAHDGLLIESPHNLNGRISLKVKTVTAANLTPDYDVIFLSCKAWDLPSSIEAIKTAVKDGVKIVPLLNGISHLDALDSAFGKEQVLGGSCQIFGHLTPEGVVQQLSEVHLITWGARLPSQREASFAIAEAFAPSIVDSRGSDNIMLDMWEKFSFLATLAGMTCLMRGNVGAIASTQDGAALMQRFGQACIAVATAEGYAPREHVLARFNAVLQSRTSTLTASMYRDLSAGGKTEADHIVGHMLKKAREHGVDDVLLACAYAHLQVAGTGK